MFKTAREKQNEYEKKVYNSSIIQGIFDTLWVLEEKVIVLENKVEELKKEKENDKE